MFSVITNIITRKRKDLP